MHALECAWFYAKIAYEDALGISLVFTSVGDQRSLSAAWPPNEIAVWIRQLGGCRYETPFQTWLILFSGLFQRWKRRSRNRRMEPPFFPCFSRDKFGGQERRPSRRLKPPIGAFLWNLLKRPHFGLAPYIYAILSLGQSREFIFRFHT